VHLRPDRLVAELELTDRVFHAHAFDVFSAAVVESLAGADRCAGLTGESV